MMNPAWIQRQASVCGVLSHRVSQQWASSVPQALLACCECGAKGSLGFTGSTIWNGALFNVAYVERSGLLHQRGAATLWLMHVFLSAGSLRNTHLKFGSLFWDHVLNHNEPDQESNMSSRPYSLKHLCALTLSSSLQSVFSSSETLLFSKQNNNTVVSLHIFLWPCDKLAAHLVKFQWEKCVFVTSTC